MKYSNPEIESSYRAYDIGQTRYDVVLDQKPKKIIELGVLNGYSTIAMAMALDRLGRGVIKSYDMWHKYPYRNTTMRGAEENIRSHALEKYVELYSADCMALEPEEFDLLHIDLSNTGKIIRELVEKWAPFGGRIIFEGGSKARDAVEWMKKYRKEPINGCGVEYEVLNYQFPSLSIVCKE